MMEGMKIVAERSTLKGVCLLTTYTGSKNTGESIMGYLDSPELGKPITVEDLQGNICKSKHVLVSINPKSPFLKTKDGTLYLVEPLPPSAY